MGPISAITTCLRKSFDFSGRASRAEFWWFAALWLVGGQIAGFLVAFPVGFHFGYQAGRNGIPISAENQQLVFGSGIWATFAVYGILALPFFAALIRRLHDTGHRGLGILTIPAFIVGCVLLFGTYNIAQGATPEVAGKLTGMWFTTILILSPFSKIWSLTRPSTPGPNRYGPNPLEVTP